LLCGTCAIVSVAFSPDSRLLATANVGGSIELWDTDTGRHVRVLTGITAVVRALTFSADSSRLATGDITGNVKIWDVATGHEQRSFSTTHFLRGQVPHRLPATTVESVS
jgi:WD40 repeat protein